MGHRANLVLVESTGYQLFFCHWCSKSIPQAAFWGPDQALSFVLQQKPVSRENGWLDDVWSEGGLLIDPTRKVMLLYGGEDLLYVIPLRRLYLELLRENWSGWNIRWAHEGIFDLADYVGLPRSTVFAAREYDDRVETFNPPNKPEYTHIVGSLRLEDNSLRLYPLSGDLEWYLSRGPQLVEIARANPGLDSLPLHEWMTEFPQGGFHLDPVKKQVAFWTAHDQEIIERIRPFWDGWEFLWLKDRYEYQLEQAGARLTFPLSTVNERMSDIENILLAEYTSGLKSLLELVKQKEEAGHQVEINPSALRDDPLVLEFSVKKQIFDRAVAAWKSKHVLN